MITKAAPTPKTTALIIPAPIVAAKSKIRIPRPIKLAVGYFARKGILVRNCEAIGAIIGASTSADATAQNSGSFKT